MLIPSMSIAIAWRNPGGVMSVVKCVPLKWLQRVARSFASP
jgi:hypothetical protein